MNEAQQEWKAIWKQRNQWREPRFWQKKVRREAALERIIARQARRIAQLEDDVEQYQQEQDSVNPWIITEHDEEVELNDKFTQEAKDHYMRFIGGCR